MTERIAVIGLGYVGLPVALAFARKYADTIGFDIDPGRIAQLRNGFDRTHEVALLGEESVRVDDERTGLGALGVPPPRRARGGGGIRQFDARARVPAPQETRLVRVVREEEVLDGMSLAARGAGAVAGRERVRALDVRSLTRAPRFGVEARARFCEGRGGHHSRVGGGSAPALSAFIVRRVREARGSCSARSPRPC